MWDSYDGSEIELGTGTGKEYGITLRSPGDRVSIRFNKYVSTLVGATGSTLGTANNIAEAPGGGGNFIRSDVPAIEQAALRAGAPIDPKWRASRRNCFWCPLCRATTSRTPTRRMSSIRRSATILTLS